MSSPQSAWSSSPSASSSSSFSPVSQPATHLDQTSSRSYSRLARPQPTHRAAPPRLPSPRIFRDFFTAMSDTVSRRQAVLPPATFQDTMQDVRSAIQRASRALENAQEAFQSRSSTIRSEVVDLTGSPPDRSPEARFMSHTTHPHDSAPRQAFRRMNTLHEPVYGPPSSFTAHPNNNNTAGTGPEYGIRTRTRRGTTTNIIYFNHLPRPNHDPQDEQAIRRQRENHHAWQRTQARAREFQNHRRHQTSPIASVTSSSVAPDQISIDSRPSSSHSVMSEIEAVDLTAVEDDTTLAAALSRQRADAVASQKAHTAGADEGRTILSAYKCPICMETPRDATTTICGHLFCHRCIIDTLKWSAEQRREEGTRKSPGVCPVCRKPLNIRDAPGNARTLVPLELKFLTRKRKRDEKGKEKVHELSDDDVKEVAVISDKENEGRRSGKARKRESTEEALWGEFMND